MGEMNGFYEFNRMTKVRGCALEMAGKLSESYLCCFAQAMLPATTLHAAESLLPCSFSYLT